MLLASAAQSLPNYNGTIQRGRPSTSLIVRSYSIKNLFQSFLLLLLSESKDREAAQTILYLKVEAEILRGKIPGQIRVTKRERQRLIRFARPLGKAIAGLVTIVSPRTFLRWLNAATSPAKPKTAGPGRPKTDEKLRELILKMAHENTWGYTRIHGELKKLGLDKISRTTVANILREAGMDPAPERSQSTWMEFVKRHAETLFACDFFTKKVWTLTGLKTYYILFFIHIATRRVHFGGFTTNPDRAWMMQQAGETADYFGSLPFKATHLIRDRDGKFVPEFDVIMQDHGVEIQKTAPRQPNQNAYAERMVLSAKTECFDHFIVCGEDHLRHLISEYEDYYNHERPHQSLDNRPLTGEPPSVAEPASASKVQSSERLGGLIKHYYHQAA